MGVGTCEGEVVVVDWDQNKVLQHRKFPEKEKGDVHPILALTWLRQQRHKDRLLVGSSSGRVAMFKTSFENLSDPGEGLLAGEPEVLQLYDTVSDDLTSVHNNCDDTLLVASGYTKDVQVLDIHTNQVVRTYTKIHDNHINICRFANHMPNILLTCSFDSTLKLWDNRIDTGRKPIYTVESDAGNVMVTFSPNDMYFLSSAIDNEVKQYCTVDGRIHLSYDLQHSGSSVNFTRSYYSDDGDTIISGSSNADEVFVCCTRTGDLLTTVPIYEGRREPDLYIQSLRDNPLCRHRFSVLAFYRYSDSPYELVDVNLQKV